MLNKAPHWCGLRNGGVPRGDKVLLCYYTHRLTFVLNANAVTSFIANKRSAVLIEILTAHWHVDFNFLNGGMLACIF